MLSGLFSKKASFSFFLLLVLLFLGIPTARADFKLLDAIQEFGERRFVKPEPARLQVGPIRVHSQFRQKATYDDNILLEDEDEREDVIWNLQPSVILELPVNTHQIAVGYEADFEIFSKSRHANQTDQNQNAFALVDLRFPDWYINILDHLSETSGRSGTTFTSRIPRIDHSIHPKIGYRWRRFILEVGYRHFTRDFRRQIDDSLDFQLNEWTMVLFYDLFARLKALFETQVSQIDYDDNFSRNGTFTQFRVGVEGELRPNLEIKARTGVQFRNYEVESEPDFNSWVASLRMDYHWRENVLFTLSMERVPLEATFGNVNFFKRHIIRFGTEYGFATRWTLFHNFKYYRDSYAERASAGTRSGFRRDNHLTFETGLRFAASEWWELEMAYEFLYRNSNFNTFDYTDNRFSVTSVFTY